ncbi:DNA-directed DNA polymerase [Tanacetum coccineum]
MWDDISPPMRVSSISEAMRPTFRGRLKKACNQISFLETPIREVGLKNPYLNFDYCRGSHETNECKQTNPAEQGHNKRKEKGEDGLEWTVRNPPFPTPPTSANHTEGATEKEGPKDTKPSIIQEPAPRPFIFYQPSKSSNLPFPSRLKKQKKDDEDERLLSIFKQIHINLPFLEAMIHMPKGGKVLKDLLSHKEKLKKAASSVKLSEECSAIIQRSLPQKEGDLGSFTLRCLIDPLPVKNALADLGASINLMPYSLFRRLGISKLKHTKMSIQLADRSIKYPIGVCENLLVKISKFIFPVDFVVLEMDEDELVPIILGRPFLATTRAVIDVHEGKLSLRVGIDTINHNGKWTEEEEEENSNEALAVSFYPRIEPAEPLEWKAPDNRLKPSSVEPPKLESKELPEQPEYAFLQENNQLSVVISSALFAVEKARLLEVLRNHKGAIAWNIVDIKGIDSSFCTHKILMDDEFKPSVQPQRRVNPNIKEVVKKEVIKLLDAGLIYPISDSPWVSPVQVVPKKGGMTVVKKEKDELIPLKPRLIRWISLLQDFDIEIRDKKGAENLAVDHLSRLENRDLGKLTKAEIRDLFPEGRLVAISDKNNEPCVLTESYECAWPEMRLHKFFDNVTADHLEDIMASPLPQEKSSRPGFTGHISSEMHHKAYWAIKNCNMDLTKPEENRFLQINELDEMRLDAYETSISYKERTKRWHDKRIKAPTNYERGDEDMKNDAIELYDKDGNGFIVYKKRVKPYQKFILDTNRDDDVTLDDEGEVT